MKILKIEFKNINSLRNSHEIDFTKAPFRASSLFAITGPTGSGKSTILDVISLALFNHVPRVGKISTNQILSTGAILTRNQTDAFARITYESKHGHFSSQWSISTNRNGKLRDYEMEICDLTTNNLLDLKKSDVPAKNEELIGLNYNQFIKSVLLAQGEFAQFLKVKKDERGELLEKITGTGIYRKLGRRSFEKRRESESDIKQQQQEIEIIQKQLLNEEDHKELDENLKNSVAKCEPMEKAVEGIDKSISLKKQIADQQKEIAKTRKNEQDCKAVLAEFETEQGEVLKQHEKVQDYSDELRNWSLIRTNIEGFQDEINKNQEKQEQNYAAIEEELEKLREFTKTKVDKQNFQQVLQDFVEKVVQLQEKRTAKGNEYRNLQQLFTTETRGLAFQLKEDHDKNIAGLKELKISSEEKLDRIREKLAGIEPSAIEKEKPRLKQKLENARNAWRQSGIIQQSTLELERINTEKSRLEPLLKTLPQEITQAEKTVEVLRNKLENFNLKKQNQLLRASLEELRQDLKTGKPCPLCGSPEHPYAEHLPDKDNALDEQIATTEKELTSQSSKLSRSEADLGHFSKQFEQLQTEEKRLNEQIKKQKSAFKEQFDDLEYHWETNWEEHCNNFQGQLDLLEQFEKENQHLNAIKAGLPLLEQLKKVLLEGKEVADELKLIYTGKDIQMANRLFQNKWITLQQEQKSIAEQQENLSEKLKTAREKFNSIECKLSELTQQPDFANIADARKALLPDAEYNTLRIKRDTIKSEISKSETALKLLHSQLERNLKDDVEESLEELETQFAEQKEKLESVKKECEEFRRQLNNHRDNLVRQQKIKSEISEKEQHIRRWKLLDELIGDSKGKKFNDFAQDLTLMQLLQLANIRLKDLSDRYKIDKPAEDEDDGLVAIDEHMGGQRRSVKTLSGGETFLLSLSMALALSDLASKSVEINSLFIDEGFGTLDPETLDQTLDTLEKLQAESSKTIGIISHVDSLKERIATQIQLKRNGQGYSSLEVK